MLNSILECWFLLVYFDLLMRFRGFTHLHQAVQSQKVAAILGDCESDGALCHAMDLACVFYFKTVLCLQRSAATTVLLRRYGFPADLVIGAQLIPFQSHAWVEIEHRVVNDKPYVVEMFQEMDRC